MPTSYSKPSRREGVVEQKTIKLSGQSTNPQLKLVARFRHCKCHSGKSQLQVITDIVDRSGQYKTERQKTSLGLPEKTIVNVIKHRKFIWLEILGVKDKLLLGKKSARYKFHIRNRAKCKNWLPNFTKAEEEIVDYSRKNLKNLCVYSACPSLRVQVFDLSGRVNTFM